MTNSEDETIALGEAIGLRLRAGDVIALDGELGAGKTRLVRGIARGMGLDERLVSSPTFVIVNHYPPSPATPDKPGLFHVDAYRLRGPDELESVGWDRVMSGGDPVVVEWAARLGDAEHWAAGKNLISIAIAHGGGSEQRREFRIAAPAEWSLSATLPKCPTCGGAVQADSAAPPFCSDRCRMADLGKWFSGKYTVSRDATEKDYEDSAG